jgi:hypothetical protein
MEGMKVVVFLRERKQGAGQTCASRSLLIIEISPSINPKHTMIQNAFSPLVVSGVNRKVTMTATTAKIAMNAPGQNGQ